MRRPAFEFLIQIDATEHFIDIVDMRSPTRERYCIDTPTLAMGLEHCAAEIRRRVGRLRKKASEH